MNIQSAINRLANQHEPRTKRLTSLRLKRENDYELMNQQIEDELLDMGITTMSDVYFAAQLVRKPIAKNSDNWQDTANMWSININGELFSYYTGIGIKTRPTLDDVLYVLCLDAQASEESFEDWCDNAGYDIDSRNALETYLKCQNIALQLRKAKIDIIKQRERLANY